MRRLSPALAALPLALLTACTPSGGADLQQAVESMIEVKVEMRMAIDELRQARADLDQARGEIDRARGDLDRARRALDAARTAFPDGDLGEGDASPRPTLADRTIAPELAAGITCATEDTCTIKRSVIDALFADPASLTRQARIVPALREGETVGFKLYGIRTGSLPKLLGLKNGDLVQTVNGKKLTSVDTAMEVYGAARKAQKLDLTGDRKGEFFRLVITVVDG